MAPKKSSVSPLSRAALASLSNDALCRLRDDIAALLNGRAESLRREFDRLTGGATTSNGKNAIKARRKKIAPKYRGPGGQTWGGRGARPRWLSNAIEEGRKLEDFLITAPSDRTGS